MVLVGFWNSSMEWGAKLSEPNVNSAAYRLNRVSYDTRKQSNSFEIY